MLLSTPAYCWTNQLKNSLDHLSQSTPAEFGVFVKDINTGTELSFHGDESWYIASGVKLPIACEVLRQIEKKQLSFATTVKLGAQDYMDSSGFTNDQAPGSALSIKFLLEQMLIHSDNTASDLLFKLVGVPAVNKSLRQNVPQGFGPITTLADVRRHAYSSFHPQAWTLANPDFLILKSLSEKKRLQKISELLHIQPQNLQCGSIDEAFARYYEKKLNSATLRAYGSYLENIFKGKVLHAATTEYLLQVMSRVETGKNRLIAGLPSHINFAHKTGTQHKRVCDFGIAWGKSMHPIVIAACTKNFSSLAQAEKLLKSVGRAISQSGIFPL